MKISQRFNHRDSAKGGKRRRSKEKKALVIARQKGLSLAPDVPQTREEMIHRMITHRNLSTHPVPWFRHYCTDYDSVLDGIVKRLQGYSGDEASAHLKKLSYGMFRQLLSDFRLNEIVSCASLLEVKRKYANAIASNSSRDSGACSIQKEQQETFSRSDHQFR